MKSRVGWMTLVLGCGLVGLLQTAVAQRGETAAQTFARSCANANSGGVVTVQAPQKGTLALNLCEGHALSGSIGLSGQTGSTQPLVLASGDFDEDGVPDLISGFAAGKGGKVTVHRGNIAALWPYGAALRNGPPQAFLPTPKSFTLPEMPDFLVAGDFDADGHWDIVTAQRGSDALYFLKGDGRGGFRDAKRFPVNGAVTAMISGEINRADGLADLIVAVNTGNGPKALIFESPSGALTGTAEIFKLAQPASALALGRFDGGAMNDLAVAAGNQLIVIHAHDRKLSQGEEPRASVAKANVTVQEFPFVIRALTSGDFTGTGPGIAALDEDGKVHLLVHAISPTALGSLGLNNPNSRPTMQVAKGAADGKAVAVGGTITPGLSAKLSAMRASVRAGADASEWTEHSSITLPAGYNQTSPRLIMAHVTGSLNDDLLIPDAGNRQIHVLSSASNLPRLRSSISSESLAASAPVAMKLMASLEAANAPVAVLPMRLNQHGLNGIVALHTGQSEPTLMPQDVPPANTFTVTNTSDAIIKVGTQYTGPAGSLRKAIYDANLATGTSSIVFNIPTTDPGYNAQKGTFLIQPLSESVPGALNDFALPPIDKAMTIDGYTQPGASPNTLASGDNARILIQIDGGKATTPGGSGLVPFDDNGSVFRGLDFTGWTDPDISQNGSGGSTASGAEGIEANGVGDFIEGNFFGTDPSGKVAAPNRIGIFADNGPLSGSAPGNIIGGTTPQARNLLSGNHVAGVLFLATAFEAQLQGNFIGTDITGTAPLGNGSDGAGLNGPTVTIGGTLPGTANVIVGNGTNVDINDITNFGAAKNSRVQGNLIGTDATGTHIVSSGVGVGVSIVQGPQSMLIGGTTPSARNIISGNLYGVYFFDNSFYNTVQGNFIGTDISGTKALGNTNQGFLTGASSSSSIAAGDTTIGGAVPGAGNLISGNGSAGVSISGTSNGPNGGLQTLQGNTILGNYIGTDVTGTKAIPNGGSGVSLSSEATNNVIGGTNPGSANLIAYNSGDGVLIDPAATTAGEGIGNNTIANVILSNNGAGVRIISGTGNRISQNSIFGNKSLGIDVDVVGPDANTHCNSSNTGANGLQNTPVLTAGNGTGFISATATDPNGNTSEFSNAVKAPLSGNVLSLMGNFDSAPNTSYTIEFFSNTAADASGFGQGQTYLTSTNVSTGADCTVAINDPVDTAKADLSVTVAANSTVLSVGPDFGYYNYTGTVANNGAATAHNVVFTDILPAGLEVSNAYCNVGPCQTPIVTSLGSCTVNHQTITCNLGTMAPGATASVTIPVQATGAGSLANTATVKATETDPKPANNTFTATTNVTYPYPFIDHLDPTSALTISSGNLPLTVYGSGFLPTTSIDVNGTVVPTTGYLDNQVCGGPFSPGFCSALQVSIPASLVNTAGTVTVTATNPDPGPGGGSNFPSSANLTLVASCTYSADFFGFNPVGSEGDTLIPESVEVTTNAPGCPWTATSNASWLSILDNARGTGSGQLDVAVAPNTGAARTGTLTVAGQTVEIDQEAGNSSICTYGLNPASAHIPAAGITGSFAVSTASNCSYFVEAYPQDSTYVKGVQFITIARTTSLLVGNGNPSYTVAANHGAPRTGAIMVGGDVFTINQDAPACYYTLDSTSALIPATGGSGSIGVKASSPNCNWTAKSSNSSQASISSGASGTGNGTVKYNVPANTGGPETPIITIGDATGYSIFSITQASAFTCTFTISPNPKSVGSNGTTDYFTVTASYSFCKWTASSNDPSALTITGSTAGTGTKAVFYAVGQNTTGAPRTLTITAGCNTFTVNQDGAQASNPAPVITSLLPATTTAGSGAFTLTVNGTGFIGGSVVDFNGIARATTFVSATKLTAAILASDVASPGARPVTVSNPSPGGGTSNAATFTITAANNPVPVITTLQPTTVSAGSGAFTLTVNGSGFVSSSIVNFNGVARATTFVNATKLTAAILATDVAATGTPTVTVTNPAPGGGTSNAVTFTITAANNPVPAITTLQPASITAGSAGFTLTINGSGFVTGSVVKFNGAAKATTFVSATKLTAAILATDVAATGTPTVIVTNPTPGGGTSNAVNFTITAANNPVPAITTLQPASIAAGSAGFTMTINGSGFVSGAVVKFNGAAKATTFVSATKLTAAILATDVAATGTPTVTVTNPTPGGGTSNTVNFTITAASNPVPVITALQPASIAAGSAAFTLTINGSGFVSGSVVKFNGTAKATTFVSATQLIAAVLSTDVATAGTPTVTVTNPAPGGGTSNAVTFTITAGSNPTPTITSLQPASVLTGSGAFTLTVNGTKFVGNSVVNFNGSPRATTFVSATQLTAAILATDVTTAGASTVTVTNPTPGGGTSNSVSLSINNPPPAITALLPQSVQAGSAAFSLTVSGTGFNASSVVTFNGQARTTTLVSSTQLTAAIPATDVAHAATIPVSVVNPAPGGGTAAAVNFSVTAVGIPKATLNPTALAFPNTNVGESAPAQTITLANPGTASLTITAIVITGANPADFSQTNTCGTSLAAGSSCTIAVTFKPASGASFAAALSVADNATGSPQTVALSGTGVVPPAPAVSLTPASLSFSAVTGATTAAQTATLKNTGNASLVITGITIAGANAANFSQTNTCGSSLEAGSSCSISVTFAPTSVGSYTATLSVADSAPGSPHSITLSGAGNPAPSFTLSSSTTAQTIPAGGSAQYSISVSAQNGTFANPVTLSATGLPTGATATFAPATLTPGSSSATSQLTVQTAASTTTAGSSKGWFLAAATLPLACLTLTVRRFRRRWITFCFLLLASLGAATAMTGCGGGFALPGSGGTTYNITVTGTSGAEQQSSTVQLIVK